MPLRVLHIGDLHLGIENYSRPLAAAGYGSRVDDYLRSLDAALARAPEAHLIVFAGDVYKNCLPNPTVQREFAGRVRQAARHAPVVIIPGNHDVPSAAGRANSVDIFAALEVERVRILREPQALAVETAAGPAIVAALPFVPKSFLLSREEAAGKSIAEALAWMRDRIVAWLDDHLAAAVGELRAELGDATPCVLLAHYTASGARFGGYRGSLHGREIEIPPSALRNPAFDYVALGHIHRHQRIGMPGDQPPVVYAGSIERVDFSEENEEKCFVMAEVARGYATWEAVPLPARRFVTIRVDADPADPRGSVLAAIEKESERLPGSMVRLVYTLRRGLPNLPDAELRQALRTAHYIAGIRRELPAEGAGVRGLEISPQMAPLDALRLYLRAHPDLHAREEELMEYAGRLVE